MKRFHFLPDLKLAAIAVLLLTAAVAVCFSPKSRSDLPPTALQIVDNHDILHVGKGQPAGASSQYINENAKVTIFIREDQPSLQLRYNLPGTHAITLRLYDQSGSLQHIEKLMNVYEGMERALDLTHLEEGNYRLQLSTEKGTSFSQEIALHTHKQM